MKVYIITEEQKKALLNELELAKLKHNGSYFLNDGAFNIPDKYADQLAASIHRQFHYLVCKYLD